MNKRLAILALGATLIAAQAFATYVVVMKDGGRYRAKAKWTVVNGKAIVSLENGSTLALDPSLIDEKKSDDVSGMGLGDVRVIATETDGSNAPSLAQKTPLGNVTKLRGLHREEPAPTQAPLPMAPAPSPTVGAPRPGQFSGEVTRKFAQAYENVGLYEQKITSTGTNTYHVELTADNEDKVFNAISATSFLMLHNGGIPGAQIDMVELFLKTTSGGSAGRFMMSRDDANALETKQLTQKEYFVRKVLF